MFVDVCGCYACSTLFHIQWSMGPDTHWIALSIYPIRAPASRSRLFVTQRIFDKARGAAVVAVMTVMAHQPHDRCCLQLSAIQASTDYRGVVLQPCNIKQSFRLVILWCEPLSCGRKPVSGWFRIFQDAGVRVVGGKLYGNMSKLVRAQYARLWCQCDNCTCTSSINIIKSWLNRNLFIWVKLSY